MPDAVDAAGVTLALAAAIAGFGYLALLAGHVLRAEGLRQIKDLLDRLQDARRRSERRALAELGATGPTLQQILAAGHEATAVAVKRVMKEEGRPNTAAAPARE